MSEYLLEIAAIVHSMANIGEVIEDDNLVVYALGRLGDEYEQFIDNVTCWAPMSPSKDSKQC